MEASLEAFRLEVVGKVAEESDCVVLEIDRRIKSDESFRSF